MHHIQELLEASRLIFNHTPYPMFMTDMHGHIIWWSDEAEKNFGYKSEDVKGEYVPLFDRNLTDHFTDIWESLSRSLDPLQFDSVPLFHQNGESFTASIVAKSFTFENERFSLFQINFADIQNTENTSFIELQLLKKGLSESFMLVYLDKDGIVIHANDKFLSSSKWTPKRVLGKSFWQLIPNTPEHVAKAEVIVKKIRNGENFYGPIEKITKTGQIYWVNLLVIPITDSQKKLLYYLLLEEEITEKKLLQTKLEQIAYVDTETGLISRHRLEEIVAEYIRDSKHFSFVYISIDQFYTLKEIFNDQTETMLLTEFTKRLKVYFRDSIIARTGRDEFALITPLSDWYIQEFIYFLKQKPIYLNNKMIPLTVSGAITKFPEDQQSYINLLKASTATIQKIKIEGGGSIAILSQSDHHKLSRRIQIEKRLLLALDHNDLHVMYLPQVDVATGKVIAVEALVRWEDEVLGTVSPDELIPIAEETGLINEIGTFVLEKACEQAAIWQRKEIPLKVSYNSSIREFRDKNMVKTIRKVLEKYNCSPSLLQIEFTEKFAIEAEGEQSIIGQMRKLQLDGVTFTLDDFGTGYASLHYLQLLPIDEMKIDSSFISSITGLEKQKKLVQGLIHLGHSLGVRVVAEGVEHESQYLLLKDFGCDALQGYYISLPISAEEVEKLF